MVYSFYMFFYFVKPHAKGMIPIVLHVDGAEFYSNSEYMCWSMASLLADSHVFDSKFPLVILPHTSMAEENVKAHVHTMVASVIGWSLKYAALGAFPTTGPFGEELKGWRKEMAGKRIASGWKATYFCFRADEKARKETNYFYRSYQHSMVCMYCMAARPHKDWVPEMCYKNMHSTAAHRLTTISFLSQFGEFLVVYMGAFPSHAPPQCVLIA